MTTTYLLIQHPHVGSDWPGDGDRTYLLLNDDGSVTHERRQAPHYDCGHRSWDPPFVANENYPEGVPRYLLCIRCKSHAEMIYGPWSRPTNESGSEGTGSRTGYPRDPQRGDAPYHPHDHGVRKRGPS